MASFSSQVYHLQVRLEPTQVGHITVSSLEILVLAGKIVSENAAAAYLAQN